MHYEDVAKFTWGGCDRVDISQINIYIATRIFFYFCRLKLTWSLFICLCKIEPNNLNPDTPLKAANI